MINSMVNFWLVDILIIYYLKNTKIKIIYNNKEKKFYNKFCTIYKKIINIYSNYVYFKYYSIKPFIICIYKISIYYYNKQKLYLNQYSIMFLLYIIYYILSYIIDYYIYYILYIIWSKGAKLYYKIIYILKYIILIMKLLIIV